MKYIFLFGLLLSAFFLFRFIQFRWTHTYICHQQQTSCFYTNTSYGVGVGITSGGDVMINNSPTKTKVYISCEDTNVPKTKIQTENTCLAGEWKEK